MDYNKYYSINKNAFGTQPEDILIDHAHLITGKYPVLDVGAGQGRNTVYLSKQDYRVDAIDPSSVSVRMMDEIKAHEKLNFNTFHADFKDFSSERKYSAVLVFGLLQILDWDEIALLQNKISRWLREGGLLFITSFTVDDGSYSKIKESSKEIGKNSYLKPGGEKRTFFEPDEIKKLFQEYKPLHYWEGIGPEHSHGDGFVERHAMVEAVFQH
jgi:cyclopropane fatty-acyl-phospholipid synthase-like methyltransferase